MENGKPGLGARSRSLKVKNWKAAGRLPKDTFLILRQALNERGMDAPPSLWGIKEPERAES